MTKKDFIKKLAPAFGSKKDAEAAVRTIFDAIADVLLSGDEIAFRNFGAFRIRTRRERYVRSPQTKRMIKIPEKRVVRFVPYGRLKNLR